MTNWCAAAGGLVHGSLGLTLGRPRLPRRRPRAPPGEGAPDEIPALARGAGQYEGHPAATVRNRPFIRLCHETPAVALMPAGVPGVLELGTAEWRAANLPSER